MWGIWLLTRHQQFQAPASLFQKALLGFLYRFGACYSLTINSYGFPIQMERGGTIACKSLRQHSMCHFDQGLVMRSRMQAYMPARLCFKLRELFCVARPGNTGKVEAQQ